MKNSGFILGAITLAICPFVSMAQNGIEKKPSTLNSFPDWMNQIQLADSLDQPQQVISLTDSIIPLALKAGNDDVALRAIIYQYNNQTQLNLNSQTANLNAFLSWVEQLHNPSYKAIGYMYFLSKNYPVLYNEPERLVLDNLNECLKTMKPEPVSGFSNIIRLNPFTEIIAPTLGDYLRFLFVSQFKNNITSDEELNRLMNNYLDELEKSSSEPTRMYAQFLRIGNDLSLDDYSTALLKLYEQYKDIPESGLLLSGYFNQDKQKEVTLLEDYMKRFPKSDFSGSFSYKLDVLNNPICQLQIPYQVYPNTAIPFQANSYLMKQFDLNFENGKKKSIDQNYVLANPGKYTFTKESLLLPKLSEGTWNIVPKDGQKRDYKPTITSTQGIGYVISNRIIGVDYKTGEPIKKGSVYLYQNKIAQEYALHNGMYEIPDLNNNKANYYAVRKGATPSVKSFLFQTQKPNRNEQIRTAHLLTDKPIYKPGDSVRFKLWSWEATNKTAQALSNVQGLVYLYDTNYKVIDSTQVVTDKYGTAWGGFQLPQLGLNGSHQLVASLDKASKNGIQSSESFQVEDYKAPTFMIQLNKPDSTYSLNTPIHITGRAYSYNGLPLRNQTIAYSGNYTPLYRFFFGAHDQQMNFSIAGEIKTNDEGDFSFVVTTPDKVRTNRFIKMWNLQLTATATDQKGETQSQSLALIVSDKKYRLTVNVPAFMDLSKAQLEVNVTARNLTNQNLDVTGRWELLNNQKRSISQGTWNSNEPIQWTDFRKFATGEYQLNVSYDNDTISKNIILYNSAKKELAIDTTLMVIPLEESKNRIYLVTSEPELHVLYALSRSDKESEYKWLRLRKGMLSLDLPELPEGVYATLQVATVRNYKFKTETYNYNNAVKLDSLDVSSSTFRDKLTPGAKENWTLHISKNGKVNIDQSVLAYMYDKALDTYMSYENPFNVSLIKSNPALNIISSNGFGTNYMNIQNPIKARNGGYNTLIQFGFFSDRNFSMKYPLMSKAVRGVNRIESMTIENTEYDIAVGYGAPAAKIQNKSAAGLRTNFADCAFFYPNIPTSEKGETSFSFTLPDLITEWKFVAIANTPDMQIGKKEYTFTAQKSLMIQTNEPGFLRQGDESQINATLSYLDKPAGKAIVSFELIDPVSNKVISQTEKEIANPQQVNALSFPVTIPGDCKEVVVRLKATSGDFSDGEQFRVPVMSADIALTETMSLNTPAESTESFVYKVPDMQTLRNQQSQFKLEVVKNPAWFVADALSALLQPTHKSADGWISAYYANTLGEAIAKANPKFENAAKEKLLNNPLNEKTANTPWVNSEELIEKQMQQLSLLYMPGQMEYLRSNAFNNLKALQNPDGGFSWFPGMPSSLFQTLNVLQRMGELTQLGVIEYGEQEKMLQIEALKFVDQNFVEMSKESKTDRSAEPLSSLQIRMLYVRSLYNDIPLAGETLKAHKAWMSQAKYSWARTSLYSKALLANVLYNYGFGEEADQIVKSIINYGVSSKLNGFWFPSNTTDQLATQVAVMQLFYNTPAKDLARFEQMKLWLIAQKETRLWRTGTETLDAVFALTMQGANPIKSNGAMQLYLGDKLLNTNAPNLVSMVLTTDDIVSAKGRIRIENQSNMPVYGALYRTFETPVKKVSESKQSGLSIRKEISGASQSNKIGNELTVRLTITSDKTMNFVEVSDQLAACFQPQDELSGYEAGKSVFYYKEVKESFVNFFIDTLPRGTSVIEYKVWLDRAGEYQSGIATVKSIYAPQYCGYSGNSELKVAGQ